MKSLLKTLVLSIFLSLGSCKENTQNEEDNNFKDTLQTINSSEENTSLEEEEDYPFQKERQKYQENKKYIFSDLRIYNVLYNYSENEKKPEFINISESYSYTDSLSPIISKENLGKALYRFNDEQKATLLERTKNSNNDTIFIFSLELDTIYKLNVENLPTIAYISPYSEGNETIEEYDYQLGFDLLGEELPLLKGESFVYIGKENPFQTGEIKKIKWKEIDESEFDQDLKTPINNSSYLVKTYYKFQEGNLDYYLEKIEDKRIESRYYQIQQYQFLVFDRTNKKLIFSNKYFNDESITLTQDDYQTQYTGRIFKGKPPIIYGLYSASFGCNAIEFADNNEPIISILCDNRH